MLKDKKVLICGGLVILLVVIVCICLVNSNNNYKLTCTSDKEYISGIDGKEKFTIKFKNKKIASVDYKGEISIDDFYQEYGTYTDAIEILFNNGYSYLDADVNKSDDKVTVNFNIKDKGFVLNSVDIYSNNENDKTSLRYDIKNDYENEKNSIKIGEKYNKGAFKKELKKEGYICK